MADAPTELTSRTVRYHSGWQPEHELLILKFFQDMNSAAPVMPEPASVCVRRLVELEVPAGRSHLTL